MPDESTHGHPAQQTEPPAIRVLGLGKRYAGVQALDNVALEVRPHEIRALVGENGAGKSTLVKIVAGVESPTTGTTEIAGVHVLRYSPRAARAHGVALVAQEPEHFADLTALENLFVGHWPQPVRGVVSWDRMAREAARVLLELGIEIPLDTRMGDLPLADRQMVQIGRALLLDARVLILDEPTAALGQEETRALFDLVRRLAARGVAVIYISHRLEEIFELAHTVTVLRDGRLVGTHPVPDVTREQIVRMMVGSEVRALTKPEEGQPPTAEPILTIDGLASPGRFEGISFSLRGGEILGVAGLAGSGRNALVHALGGARPAREGRIVVAGTPHRLRSPRAAVRAGLVLAPGDRPGRALVLPMTVRENITLSTLRNLACGPFTSVARETRLAEHYRSRLDIRAASLEQTTGSLSGGNQQKVSLARRLAARPRVLILEEPTQGVDVGARAEIHRLLRELASEGLAVILLSSDADELLALSDRILVMHRGKSAGILAREDATKEAVLALAFGRGVSETDGRTEEPRVRRPPRREFWLAGFLVLAFAVFAVATRGSFLATDNLRDMGVNSAYRLIAGLGITMVILTAGIDISIGSGLALCCIAAGMLATNGMAIGWVVVGTLGAGALLGAVNAGGIALMRLPPIIMTLATLTIYRGVVLAAGGGYWITGLPEQFHWLGKGAIVGLPVPVVSAALLALGSHLLLRRTTFGRSLYAVGNNPSAARHLGVSEARTQWAVYTLSGVAVALAALAYATRFQTIQTNTGNGFEMVVITAVVVGGTSIFGGRGSVPGTVLGVALLEVVSTGLNYLHVPDDWLQAFQGGLVLLAVITDYLGSRASRRGSEDA